MSVVITPVTPALAGLAFEPDGFETFSGGVGGWETLDRPRRPVAAAWVGGTEKTVDLPLLLNGVEAGGRGIDRSVESACATLESWGRAHRVTGEPPILRVSGLPTISPNARWVIQSIDWGEYLVDGAGQRIQQSLGLTLLQYLPAQLVKGPAAKARAHQKKHPKKGHGKQVKKHKHKRQGK